MRRQADQPDRAEPNGVSVIVPTLNEVRSIATVIERICRSLGNTSDPVEIIVVDDASSDGTPEEVDRLAEEFPRPVRLIRRSEPPSLSLSVIDGAKEARFETVAVLDADLSHDPADLPRLLQPLRSREADVAIGSRYVPTGEIDRWPIHRRLLSGVGTSLARRLTQVGDPLSGYFATRRPLLLDPDLRPRGYKILLELLGRSRTLRVVEIPIRFRDRSDGKSKFGLRQGCEFLFQLALIWTQRSKPSRRPKRSIANVGRHVAPIRIPSSNPSSTETAR